MERRLRSSLGLAIAWQLARAIDAAVELRESPTNGVDAVVIMAATPAPQERASRQRPTMGAAP